MSFSKRLALAMAILVLDFAAIAIPLAAMMLAYVIVARPEWFLHWTIRVYGDGAVRDDRRID